MPTRIYSQVFLSSRSYVILAREERRVARNEPGAVFNFLQLLCEVAHFGHLEFLELKGMDSSPRLGSTSAPKDPG